MQGCSFDGVRFRRSRNGSLEDFRFRRRERGTLRSPTPPRGRGARGFRPSRALPGLLWRGVWFPMMQGAVLLTAFVSDEAGTALLKISFPTMQGLSFDGVRFRQSGNGSLEIFLSRRRGHGALRSPTFPRVTGCERVATLSRSPGAILVGNSVSVDTSYSGDLFTAARDSLGLWRSSFRSIRRMYPYISFDTGWVERKYGRGFGLGGDGSAGGRTSFSGGFFSDGTSHLPLVAG